MKKILYAITIALGLSSVGINAGEVDSKALFTELTGKVDRGGDMLIYSDGSTIREKFLQFNEIAFKFFNKEFFEALNLDVSSEEAKAMAQSFMEQMPQNYMLGYAFSSKLIEKSGDKNVYIYKNAQKFSDGVEQVGLYKMLNFKDNGEFNIVKYAPQNSMFLFELSINGAGLYDFIQWCVENKFNGSLMETETSLIGDNNEVDIAALLASVDGRLGVYAAPITAKDGKTLCQVAIMLPDNDGALKKMVADKAVTVIPELEAGDLVKLSETRFAVADSDGKTDQPYCLTIYTGLDKYLILGVNLNDEFRVLPAEAQIFSNASNQALFKDMPRTGIELVYLNLNGPMIDKMLSDAGISEGVTSTIFTESDFANLPFYMVACDGVSSVGKGYLSPVDYVLSMGEVMLKKLPLVFNTYFN